MTRSKRMLREQEIPLVIEHIKRSYDALGIPIEKLGAVEQSLVNSPIESANVIIQTIYKDTTYRNRLMRYLAARAKNKENKGKYTSLGVNVEAKEALVAYKEEKYSNIDMSAFLMALLENNKRYDNEN